MKTKKIDLLTSSELESIQQRPFYVPGHPYLWVLSYGWAVVGFYVRHETPLTIRVAHTNHFRNANRDYGTLIREGADDKCEWRYEGDDLISFQHIIKVSTFGGEVPRGPIRVC